MNSDALVVWRAVLFLTPPCLTALLLIPQSMINIVNTDPQLRNAPVGLTPEQVDDPYLIIDTFFDFADHLPKYRKRLKKWLIAAIDGKHQWKRNELIRCIYSFRDIAMLLDALWLIYQKGDSFGPEDMVLRYDTEADEDRWSERVLDQVALDGSEETEYHPDFLNQEEEQVPYEVIRLIFNEQDLFEIKAKLDFWCHTAIANHWNYTFMSNKDLVVIHEQIGRILEAAFIISEVRLLKKSE